MSVYLYIYLDASTLIYKRVCRSVGPSVGPSVRPWVRMLVHPWVHLAFLKYHGNGLLRPIKHHGTHRITFIHSFIHSFRRIVVRTELVINIHYLLSQLMPLMHRSEVLSTLWHNVEITYIMSCKSVFRNQRDEREKIIKYYYNIRKDFLSYLRRPDHKQVGRWCSALILGIFTEFSP